MMEKLVAGGDDIARKAEARLAARVADRMRSLLGDEAVSTVDTEVTVEGRGLRLRWLTEPALRFIRQAFK